ncbi:MAG TPA: helix-turn-helix domain-containing protein [Bryobacteraceae bacterium]
MSEEKTLAELADAAGIPARTIRFYIARGLLDGPAKAGRGAVYTAEHLARLEKIKALQSEGRMLSEIAPILAGGEAARTGYSSSPWWQHAIDDDVVIWTRADVSPWRMKQIREAIDEIAARLVKSGEEPKTTRRNK